LLTFLRSSNFNAHHEILARTIAVPPFHHSTRSGLRPTY
jgi:hypothetical protein